ncbi:hypothetical protein ACI2LO_29795 [Streptomyces sp. NPDC033754]|uniref:hypothetical protein n=1 Tax=unclassified Streptomyces TaxID=2593676 RepID=UPI0033FAC3E7
MNLHSKTSATPDLLARTPGGDLLRYSGTGGAQSPFAKPVRIGHGFQGYDLL